MHVSRPPGHADRQSQHSRVRAIRFVKESMTAQLTLGGSFAHVVAGDFRLAAEPYRSKVKVGPAGAYYHRVRSQLFNSVYSVVKAKLVRGASVTFSPTYRVEIRPLDFLLVSPA